ncbi:unnamed protein product, partial [Didymodactylos carnosus]
ELNDTEEATDTMVGISVMERPPPSDLYRACRSNAIDKVYEYLKTASVDEINQIQSNGSTALHIASYHGHNEIVKLLLEKGASPSIRNQIYGLTAFDEARTNQTEDLFKFDPYYCTGICYRGMLLTRNDLPKYIIGHRVMNKSFISTSRSRQVAEIYSGAEQQNYLRQTPDNRPIQISTFCTYIIRNKRTALNIKSLSLFEDEEEVLIVPFSAFEVTEVKQYHHSKNARIMVELEFTECNES